MTRHLSLLTTSATWSHTPTRRFTPIRLRGWSLWTHQFLGLTPGAKFSRTPGFGTSIFMDRMRNASLQAVGVATLTEYGLTLPAIRVNQTKTPEISLPPLTHNREEYGPGSRTSPPSPRTQRTTKS